MRASISVYNAGRACSSVEAQVQVVGLSLSRQSYALAFRVWLEKPTMRAFVARIEVETPTSSKKRSQREGRSVTTCSREAAA